MFKKIIAILTAGVMSFTLIAGSASAASDTTSRTVSIFQVQGSNVKMTKGTDKEFSAKADQKLYDGYTVSTGNDSYCYLKLDDGSLLKMNQRSSVKISKASSQKLSIAVLSGGLTVDAAPQSGGSTVEVSVGNSALGIRGTYFAAENVSGKTAVFTMFEGSGIVDGHSLPSGHLMNVYDQTGNNTQPDVSDQSDEQIYELKQFEIGEDTSAFVLQTVLDDVDRFVENGTITKSDLPAIEDLLKTKREEMLREGLSAVIAGKALYNDLISGGYYSGSLDLDAVTNDKSKLQESLLWAYNVKSGVRVGDSADSVDDGELWVTQSVMNELNDAIRTAEQFLSSVATIRQVNEAADVLGQKSLALLAATTNSDGTRNEGTKKVPVNTDSLEEAISAAYSIKLGVFVNTNSSSVASGKSWVTSSVMNALNSAIDSAETALSKAATHSAAMSSAAALNNAVAIFNSNLQPGIGTDTLNRAALETALGSAYAAKSSASAQSFSVAFAGIGSLSSSPTSGARVFISNDGSDVDEGKQWVTSAEMYTMNTAISAAETAFSTATTTGAITGAVSTLGTAVLSFNAVKKDGLRVVADSDRRPLQTAINKAYDAKRAVMIGTTAADVFDGTPWVTLAEMMTLNDAITEAEVTYITVSSKATVDTATATLNAAVTVFNNAKKLGVKALDLEELVYAITAANEALAKVDVEYFIDARDGRDTNWELLWVTQAAVDALTLSRDAGEAALVSSPSQVALRTAIRELNWEVDRFYWSVRQGKQPNLQAETGTKVWRNTRTNDEYSNLSNAMSAANNGDTLELFEDTVINYAAAENIDLEIIVNQGVTLEIGSIGILFVGGTFVNNGTITNNSAFAVISGGTFENNGTFNNKSGARVTISGATFIEDSGKWYQGAVFNNNGTFSIDTAASLTVEGTFNNNAALTVYGDLTFAGASEFVNDGVFILNPTGKFIYNSTSGTVINNGTMTISPALFGSNFDMKTDMELVGGEGAYVDVLLLPATGVGKWGITNFYNAAGTSLQGSIPVGKYVWDSSDSSWRIPVDPTAPDKTALEVAIEHAEYMLEETDWLIDSAWLLKYNAIDGAIYDANETLKTATTQEQLDIATNELLVSSIDALNYLITLAGDVLSSDPANLSAGDLSAAIGTAVELLKQSNLTVEDIYWPVYEIAWWLGDFDF